jgi:RsiW-degrading membrane proteinase PrsW (M82 family)
MTEPVYPPPPPSQIPFEPQLAPKKGFHGPETHIFMGIRTKLAFLEQSLQASLAQSPRNGLLVALVLGASLSIGASLGLELVFSFVGVAGFATIFPLFEEFFKGLSIFLVAWFMWKTIPSRRYGALLGASAGFGFAIVENIIFNIQSAGSGAPGDQVGAAILARWIGLPFMHVVWSAFVGIGIFVLLAQRKVSGTPGWIAVFIMLFGWVNHMCWNALALVIPLNVIIVMVLDVLIVFVPFGVILRDFLGGHFSFFNFLESVQEPMLASVPPIAGQPSHPPPPPPPPT